MGGQAIKIAQRVPRDIFFEYIKVIIPKVQSVFNTEVHMVNGFHNKQDFGDLDLLVLADRDFGNRRDIVQKNFNPDEISINRHILSFNYKELQVDLIFTPPSNWEASKIFFDWGDLGNFMGKLINNYGNLNNHGYLLKYGYDGLKCKLKYEGVSKNVVLTKDNAKVFEFLGLSFEKWKDGFNNREEMFEYVISSPLFDYNSFQWENLSSINKHRNKRRPNYHGFLEYIKKYKDKNIKWGKVDLYIENIKKSFGVDLKKEMEYLKEEVKNKKDISNKFNGKILMDKYPKLKGVELGRNIQDFKNRFQDWDNYVLTHTSDEILKDFDKYYKYGN